MLCGIGGATIAQAQRNITVSEFQSWCRYRQKYGTLDVRQKMEQTAALIAYCVERGHYRKPGSRAPKFEDYLPQREEPRELTLEEAMQLWK